MFYFSYVRTMMKDASEISRDPAASSGRRSIKKNWTAPTLLTLGTIQHQAESGGHAGDKRVDTLITAVRKRLFPD